MPYVHCNKCHHEWECATNSKLDRTCDWCGGDSYILEGETPVSKMLKSFEIIEFLEELNNPYADKVIKKLKKSEKKKGE